MAQANSETLICKKLYRQSFPGGAGAAGILTNAHQPPTVFRAHLARASSPFARAASASSSSSRRACANSFASQALATFCAGRSAMRNSWCARSQIQAGGVVQVVIHVPTTGRHTQWGKCGIYYM